MEEDLKELGLAGNTVLGLWCYDILFSKQPVPAYCSMPSLPFSLLGVSASQYRLSCISSRVLVTLLAPLPDGV